MGVQEGWARIDGLRAHYLDAGAGAPLVLLHGGSWGERAQASWGPVIEALAAYRRVIAPDWLGFGASALVRDFAAPEDRMLDHLAGLLRGLGVGRTDVVAASMGGMLVVRDQTGDRPRLDIRRLVLVSAGGPPMRPEIRRRLWDYDGTPAGMRAVLGLVSHGRVDDAQVERWHAWSREPGAYEAFAAMAVRRPGTVPPAPPDLSRLTAPTLVCAGAHDRLKDPGWEQTVAAALPVARAHVFADSGHCPQAEQPTAFVARVLRFLEGDDR